MTTKGATQSDNSLLPTRIEDFIREVDATHDLDFVLRRLENVIRAYGFEYFSYWVHHPSSLSPARFAITNYREDWREYYAKSDLGVHDYTGFASATSVTPFVWSSLRSNSRLSKLQRRVFDESADAGLENGASVPIHGPGAIKASLSVAGTMNRAAFDAHFLRHRHVLQLLATYAHEKIVTLKLGDAIAIMALTPREVEVLTWAARGKTRWEIGVILDIAEETVKSHLDRARIKLKVSNTTHAIAVAIFNGLIMP